MAVGHNFPGGSELISRLLHHCRRSLVLVGLCIAAASSTCAATRGSENPFILPVFDEPAIVETSRPATAAAYSARGPGRFRLQLATRSADASEAASLFSTSCMLCHGVQGDGLAGLGVSLAGSDFVRSATPAELVEFLRQGRLPDAPDSVSGRPMPGFAWMTDAQLSALAVYIQALASRRTAQ